MRRWPVIGVALALLWLFVRGVAFQPTAIAGGLITGLVIGLPVAYLFRRFYREKVNMTGVVRSAPYALLYLLLFVRELLTANIDVAYRVLHPSMPISPDVIEIPLRVRSDAAITTIANSITLTPGTLTMDYDEHRNALYVHAIASKDRESVIEPIRRWEDYALVVFDEELKPRDPVPDPETHRHGDHSRRPNGGDGDE